MTIPKTEKEHLAELKEKYRVKENPLTITFKAIRGDLTSIRTRKGRFKTLMKQADKDEQDLIQRRDILIAQLVGEGESVTEIARMSGLSRQQVYYRAEKLTKDNPPIRLQTNEGEK